MIQAILLVNGIIFIPLILFVEYFRSVDEYFESNTYKEAFVKGYLPYVCLFLLINSLVPFFVFPINVYKSFPLAIQVFLPLGGMLVAALSLSGLIVSLITSKWRARYGTYTTRVRS